MEIETKKETRLNIRVSLEFKRDFKQYCVANDISMSEMIIRVIKAFNSVNK